MEAKDWIALISLVVSVTALSFSIWSARNTALVSSYNYVQVQLVTYVNAYNRAFKDAVTSGEITSSEQDDPFRTEGYGKLSYAHKIDVRIVAGMFVGLLDAMYDVGDKRAETWKGYLAGFSGPLIDTHGYDILAFAHNQKTIQAIRIARQAILKS